MKHWKLFLAIFFVISIAVGFAITAHDPVEQIKKDRDENLQTYAAEFIQATVLYYSIHSALPWDSEEDKGAHCFADGNTIPTVPMTSVQDCVKLLISENALRTDYISTTPLNSLIVTNPNPQTKSKLDTIVCFLPQSTVWQKDPNTRYAKNGTNTDPNSCYSQGGTQACYWCTQ